MNIDTIIEETKRKSALINGLAIDWQYIQQLVPQVLNDENARSAPDFKVACNSLRKILDRTEEGIKELKVIVPTFPEE